MNIVYYIGPTWEKWDPESIQRLGSGGSEIAVVELAKHFTKLGHTVTVYGNPFSEKSFDNVTYLHHSKFNHINCDLLIAYRTPQAVDSVFNITYKKAILWMQDAHMGDSLTKERAAKLDKIFVLSPWHFSFLKGFYPFIADKLQLITNGLDLSLYTANIQKNQYKAFYSSSPSRGLDNLLFMWNDIVKQVPQAELHIYYGFDVWKIAAGNNFQELSKINNLQNLINNTPNTYMHGRVNSYKLAEEQMSSGVWVYPTNFYETSCITAMEAQASGCEIITSNLGALTDTVRSGVLLDGDAYSKSYREQFIKNTVKALTNPSDRQIIKDKVKDLDWAIVAEKCNDIFLNL